jgi:hypothetical protein
MRLAGEAPPRGVCPLARQGQGVQQVGIVFTSGIEFARAVSHDPGSSHGGLLIDSGKYLEGTRMYGISPIYETSDGGSAGTNR